MDNVVDNYKPTGPGKKMQSKSLPPNRELSSDEKRLLRSRHPLYTKLSGDVIWELFEENGYDADTCGKAMDNFIEDMYAVLSVMDNLENGHGSCFGYILKAQGCEQCASLEGKALFASHDWKIFLPPFAVGCALTCKVMDEEDIASGKYTLVAPEDLLTPERNLLCPLLTLPEKQ